MIGEKDEKIKFGIKVCLLIAAYIIIGFCGLFFILVSKVNALTLNPTQMQCSWNTDANTIRTENCLGGQDYNIGGYTNYVNFLPTFNSSYGSQLWTISFTLDMYVVDYGNEGDYIVTPIFQMYQNNQIQSLQNLSRQIVSQRADCSNSAGCMLIRTFNFTYQWQGDINGITIQNLSSYYNRADCGWLQDNPSTCQASYPRIHYLEMTAYYNDGQGDQMIKDSIDNQTDIITANQNSNADRIIDSNTTSAQSVINADNYNTDRTIDAIEKQNLRCENYNYDTSIDYSYNNKYLTSTGDITNGNDWRITNYIPLEKDKTYTLKTGGANAPSYCIYDKNKSIKNCESYNGRTTITITTTENVYIRYSFVRASTNYKFTGEYCYNVQDKQAQTSENIESALTDSSVNDPTSSLNGLNANIGSNSVISDLLLLPVSLYHSILNSINGTCTPFTLGTLYNHTLRMPCINIQDVIGNAIYGVIDILISGIFILSIRKKLVDIFNSFTSLKVGGNELE